MALVERMPALAGWVTLVAGTALALDPGRACRLMGLEGEEAAVRMVGVADLVLVPGLLRGRERWPWMAGRAALNVAQAAYLRGADARSASPGPLKAGAGVLAGLTVVDGVTALALRAGR